MELSNEFDVSVGIDEAWEVLTDLERIAPCLPGAKLTGVEGDDYQGTVKIKVGPITAQYKGSARIVRADAQEHVALLEASGRDSRGQGNASASIEAVLSSTGDASTHVSLVTDLSITGKVAQFGRGVIGDISAKLLTQFVENLESTVLVGTSEEAASDVGDAGTGDATDAPRTSDASPARPVAPTQDEPDAVDLLDVAGSSMLKRLLPLLGVALAALVVRRLIKRRRARRS